MKLFERIAGDIGDLEVKAACSRVVKCFEKEKSSKKSRGGRRKGVDDIVFDVDGGMIVIAAVRMRMKNRNRIVILLFNVLIYLSISIKRNKMTQGFQIEFLVRDRMIDFFFYIYIRL